MKKRIIIAACCACCSWLANSAEGFSSPVAGVADHVVSGRILPPVVTWVDKPMVLSETNKIPAGEIGHFDIRLVSSPTKLRGIIFADRCGVGGKINLTFVNETDLENNVGGYPQATITGIPTVNGGLMPGSGVAGKMDVLSGVISYAEGTDWYHETTSNEEQITVTINNAAETSGTPGVYSATYCMMQFIL